MLVKLRFFLTVVTKSLIIGVIQLQYWNTYIFQYCSILNPKYNDSYNYYLYFCIAESSSLTIADIIQMFFKPKFMTRNILKTAVITALLIISANVKAQVIINEIMAQNSTITDPDYGTSADWVELFNAGSSAVDLSNYTITDNLELSSKYSLPEGTIIGAGSYLLLWCDDNGKGLHTPFKLSADGEQFGLFTTQGEVVDTVSFGPQLLDISFGRIVDDPETWAFLNTSTPGGANISEAFDGKANLPMILTRGGLFSGSVTVAITNDLGGNVHYTVDGSQPTVSSPIYSSPLTFYQTTVLRARIIEEGKMPGIVLTETYFIDEAFAGHNLPVVSIVTENDNFWNPETGIYTQSFKPDWEVPVNIEMFLNNGSDRSAFNEAAGIKINGLYSWQLPQKMLGVYFKKKYGESKLAYQLFVDDSRSSFDNFALRASGNDWSNTLMRDGLVQQAARKGAMNLDLMAFRPCVVYVNGKFLGIHNIREKVDEDYITQHYGLKGSEFDMVEGGDTAEVGTTDAWNTFFSFATQTDFSNEANYTALCNRMDVENFTDYIITQSYCANTSLGHNTMVWKPLYGGKWRWILMDTDRGFFKFDNSVIDYVIKKDYLPLRQMLANNSYKEYFFHRLADQLFTTFNAEEISRQIDAHEADIAPVISKHVARWLGTTSSYGDAMPSVDYWYNEVDELRDFANGRVSILLDDLSNYGFQKPALLSLSAQPESACTWTFNGHQTNKSEWYGLYPKQMSIALTAEVRAGYRFTGWYQTNINNTIARGSEWMYLDNGSNLGTQWVTKDFDDSSWKRGSAPLGYSFSNVNTIVDYGTSSTNKYMTTYFRKHFNVTNVAEVHAAKIQLLREDGAVVYLNGKRVVNSNMPVKGVTYTSKSTVGMTQLAGKNYLIFNLDPSMFLEGENVIAVEVHQTSASSTDLAFDLQLQIETLPADASLLGTDETLNFTMNGDMGVCALFESSGENILPDSIHSNMTLYKDMSPYLVTGDVVIDNDARLTIEPGVELLFSPNACMYIHGAITAEGTPTDSIMFRLNPAFDESLSWGALCFINTGDSMSSISYSELRDGSNGPAEYNCVAVISGFKTTLCLDHLRITDTDGNPISCRYSDLRLTNSILHSRITGDLTNVKYGKGYIADCEFIGNDMTDTDAIDYDGVSNGVIKRVVAHDFHGSNSDAVDIGEQAEGIIIDSLLVYNITDKGISIGQRSSMKVSNSTFIQTTLGLGVKDSCNAEVDHCTFYAVQTPIASYEKVLGRAGGNVKVTECLFTNSYLQDVLCDSKSTVIVDYSLSDLAEIMYGSNNVTADPLFVNPSLYDLVPLSETASGMGSRYLPQSPEIEPVISQICYLPYNAFYDTEFIVLSNPGSVDIDLEGYSFSKGFTLIIPEGITLPAGGSLFVAKDGSCIDYESNVVQWESGKLADEGETIELISPSGIVVDHISYSPLSPWPVITDPRYNVAVLKDLSKDNHIPSNWILSISAGVKESSPVINKNVKAYDINGRMVDPKTAHGLIIVDGVKILKP